MPTWLLMLALFVGGFMLIFIEVVIIPGFGLAGILGTTAIVIACYTAFNSLSPLIGALVTLGSIFVIIAIFKLFPKTSAWKKMRLSLSLSKKMGYQVAPPGLEKLVDKTGVSYTILRPSGIALIDKKRYDVLTDGEFIEKDKKIIVYKVEGLKIFVKKTT